MSNASFASTFVVVAKEGILNFIFVSINSFSFDLTCYQISLKVSLQDEMLLQQWLHEIRCVFE